MWSWSGAARLDSSLPANWLRPGLASASSRNTTSSARPCTAPASSASTRSTSSAFRGERIVGAADAARFVSPNGTTVVIDAERVRAAVVDRSIFDRDLAASAVSAGATIQIGMRVVRVTRGQQSVTIRTTGAVDARCRSTCRRPGVRRELSPQPRARSRRAERARPQRSARSAVSAAR